MATIEQRKTDSKGRVLLFGDFARALVTIERVGEDEIRIRRRKRRRFTLNELLAQITPENMHAEVPTGAPVGKEVW